MSNCLDRLPHRGPMRWIDEVVGTTDRAVTTKSTIRPDHILARDGVVSPLAVIELFAQAACALMAVRMGRGDAKARVSGALLGTRRIDIHVDELRVGDELTVHAEEQWGAGALAQFACKLERDGELVATGSINVASGDIPDLVR